MLTLPFALASLACSLRSLVCCFARAQAHDSGCALLQGAVLSARSLPGDPVAICNPFVKVSFAEGGGGNVMFRCKTQVHVTDVVQDSRDPVWEKSKFSLELLPPGDTWEEIRGDVIFGVYDMGVDGGQVFIGQASVNIKSLMAGDDEGDLPVPKAEDRWLKILSRAGKQVGMGVEVSEHKGRARPPAASF
jgi:hypothetical protein